MGISRGRSTYKYLQTACLDLGLQLRKDCLATEATGIGSQLPEGKLLGLYALVGEFSKVLIGCHRSIFGRRGRGEHAVHEMDLRFSIAHQCIEVNRRPARLSPGLIRNALRIFPGMVVCPLLVTLECCIASSLTF